MLYALLLAASLDASPSPAASSTPAPSPTSSATPTPKYSFDGAFSGYAATTNPGAMGFANVSNAMLTLTKNTGTIRGTVTVGAYSFPTVGLPLVSATAPGANTNLYGWVPTYSLSYVPNSNVTLSAGQLPSLMGQESGFTWQDINIQRGLVWTAETTFSRGLRLAYVNGKISGTLGYDDGYYSGNSGRALEGLFGWAPTANTNWQFGFTLPGANTPGNVTASVANKREYDFMLTQQYGKLQLLPYVLLVESPASEVRGYTQAESATGLALLANWAFSSAYGLAVRVESFDNASATTDTSLNADLVGFGPGSGATTWTITPTWRPGPFFVRVDFSNVALRNATVSNQTRILGEVGVQF
jgi:hypothetical protein